MLKLCKKKPKFTEENPKSKLYSDRDVFYGTKKSNREEREK